MANVVKKAGEPNDLSSVSDRLRLIDLRYCLPYFLVEVLVEENVVYLPAQLHHSKRVFESSVCGARVDEVGQRELVDLAEALNWRRIDNSAFVVRDNDELMHWVPELVPVLRHSRLAPEASGACEGR